MRVGAGRGVVAGGIAVKDWVGDGWAMAGVAGGDGVGEGFWVGSTPQPAPAARMTAAGSSWRNLTITRQPEVLIYCFSASFLNNHGVLPPKVPYLGLLDAGVS